MDARAFHESAKDRYWKDKDLPAARRLLEEGIACAQEEGLPDSGKAMSYNLASFCWPGWDEPGIVISKDDLQAGDKATKENLRLAVALEKGDAPMANAWFMIGAYHLAFDRLAEALEAFDQYRGAASKAGMNDHALLADGYIALVRKLQGGEDQVRSAATVLHDEAGENGPEFAEQLLTAARVFSK